MAIRSKHFACHKRLAAAATLVAMAGLTLAPAHAVMRVGVLVDGTLQGASNFQDRSNVVVSYDLYREYPVPGAMPPLWGTLTAFGASNGAQGTLKARAAVQNAGAGTGVLGGAGFDVRAYMSEDIDLFSTNGSGSRNVGVAGLGDPNDNFVTVRARGTLLGSGVVGSATGVPPGFPVASAGSARGVLSVGLGLNGSTMTSFTITQTTNLDGPRIIENLNPVDTNRAYSEVSGGDILFHISKTYLSNNINATVHFSASLTAGVQVGLYSGSFADAAYHNSAYLDFDVEQGMFWLPGGPSATRKFLTAQVFPPAPVPEPGTSALLMAGLGVLSHAARRRRAKAGCVSGGPAGIVAVG